MADHGSNGTSGPHLYMPPSSDYALPAAPGAAPELRGSWEENRAPGYEDHQMAVPTSAVPATEHYEGGGIFAAATPGPSMRSRGPAPEQELPPRGLDYGPRPAGVIPSVSDPVLPGPPLPSFLPGTLPPPMGAALGQTSEPNMLGLSILGMAAGALVGSYYGGLFGGIAGTLGFGSALNAYRAFSFYKQGSEQASKEAKISGTYAVAAAALAAGVWYKLVPDGREPGWRSRPVARANPRDDEDDDACDIRPVGP